MNRKRNIFICITFIVWGVIIAATSVAQIIFKKDTHLDFADKIARKTVRVYPVRAPIVDCHGNKIAYSEWQFFLQFSKKNMLKAEKFAHAAGLDFKVENFHGKYIMYIPAAKLTDAIEQSAVFRFKLQKREVRKYAFLPGYVKNSIGITLFRRGISGLEKKYDERLRGTPGFIAVLEGPTGRLDPDSLQMIAPMTPGKRLMLKQSLTELQSGVMPTEVPVF